MDNNNLISVIIPIYGVEKYICQCLESVINQSYKNLEIIVVNDGTRDRSAEIARDYAHKDRRIRVYDYENGGLSVARNRGLKHAKGQYISFVDSDDWLHPDFYKKLAEALETNNADIAKCSIIDTDTVSEKIIGFQQSEIKNSDFDLYFRKGFLWIVVWNALYKREIVMDVPFPAGIIHEDNYVSGMYIFKAKKVVELKEPLYYYRRNLNGLSKGTNKQPFDRLLALSRLKDDLFKSGFTDKRLDESVSVEVFHLIRDDSLLFRVKAIDQNRYNYVKDNLGLRRKLLLIFLVHKKHIKIYSFTRDSFSK